MNKTVTLIPARGGSKGIPKKNIVSLVGKPLIAYSIEAALECQKFDDIVVSSDDEEILSVAGEYPVLTHLRASEYARDESDMDGVINDVIEHHGYSDDTTLVLLQPTSPLRQASHIESALNQYVSCLADALISVTTIDNKVLKAFTVENNFLQPVSEASAAYSRRQDLPPVYLPNGALYIFKVGKFLENKKIPRTNVCPYIMTAEDSIDIDAPDDLIQCAQRLHQLKVSREHFSRV